MSRGLDANNEAALEENVIAPVLFAELNFPSGYVRVHSGIGTITWGGYDWLGVGQFGTVDGLQEEAELSRKTVTYTLSGVPNDLIALALDDYYQGRTAKVYVGFFDRTTYQLAAEPELLDSGLMDVAKSKEGKTCSISITAESRIASWSRPTVRRYTDAQQRAYFPSDTGMQFISQAAQKEIVWGRKA